MAIDFRKYKRSRTIQGLAEGIHSQMDGRVLKLLDTYLVFASRSQLVWPRFSQMTTIMLKIRYLFVLLLLVMSLDDVFAVGDEGKLPAAARDFIQQQCYDCHQGADAEGGLDLTKLGIDLQARPAADKWIRIFDRVKGGEMPPPEADTIDVLERDRFLKTTGSWLREAQLASYAARGRVNGRRLTNLQLERTLHDLLGIDIPLADRMPEEPRSDGFTTVADGQAMSHFQLEQHVSVVDAALDEAFRRALSEPDEWDRLLPAKDLVRRRARSRTREPELIDDRAVTWASRVIFYGRLPETTAKEDGWYRFTIRANGLKAPQDRGVWCTVRSGRCVSSAPLLGWVGAFEATNTAREVTYEAWLSEGDMLEIRPGDATLELARFAGGQVGTGEGDPQNVAGVAIDWIKMSRIHHGSNDDSLRRKLFDDLTVRPAKNQRPATVISNQPKRDVVRLMRVFARRAFRRPVEDTALKPYFALSLELLERGDGFGAALRAGYRAVLCSPRFLYFHEQPGALDEFAIASRLSYLLWNSMPDEQLFELADDGKLADRKRLSEQVERMLNEPRGKQFVADFAAQWLDLSLIDFTEPDRKLYPGFDVIVQQSMLDETHAYLNKMLQDDLSVGHLIDSDFTFLNSRLARFYQIDGVAGDELREVALRPSDHRGGLMTHGSILKVTANGTTTSPVIRGVWISERLLGVDIPPPPENVPAIEPDVRGTKTIREMLVKHKEDSACAVCHVKIDPPGFALENYDPAGRWRDKYFSVDRSRPRPGATIDASFEMPDGRRFQDVHEFQNLVLADKRMLARNVADKLITYGTGGSLNFADREVVDSVIAECEASDFGFRSLLHAVVTSSVFLNK